MSKLSKLWLRGRSRLDKIMPSIKTAMAAGLMLVAGALTAQAASNLRVETKEGPIKGFFKDSVAEFLGIPYAAPPIGNLRWMPPKKHAPWTNVLKATSFGSNCPQIYELGVYAGPVNLTNEDCLFLNVFTPDVAPAAKEKLPVIVFIHGSGSDSESNDYDGSKLASQGHTVVVTINYRLNLFGHLAHPAIDAEGHLFGDYAVLDHQLALKWVKRNIANFGGDPNNVTVSGQSEGCRYSVAELLSPLGAGLFNRAILESCSAYIPLTPLSMAETKATAFAVAAGCGSGTDAATAACLRALPTATIEALAGNGIPYTSDGAGGQTGGSANVLGSIADGQILPTDPVKAFETGRFNHVPIISGNVENEGVFNIAPVEYYETPRAPLTEAQYVASITSTYSGNAGPGGSPPAYPAGTVAAVLAQYPLSAYPSPELQWAAAATDGGTNGCPGLHMYHIIASQVPLYAYEFRDQTAPDYFPAMPGFVSLAYHTGDIQYLFPLFHGGPLGVTHLLNKKQEKLSDQLVAAWTNFAWTGNPNGQGNSPWPRYKPTKRVFFTENISPAGLSTETEAQFAAEHNCAFWDTVLQYGP